MDAEIIIEMDEAISDNTQSYIKQFLNGINDRRLQIAYAYKDLVQSKALKEELSSKLFVKVFSENVIKKTILLSQGRHFSWKRVEYGKQSYSILCEPRDNCKMSAAEAVRLCFSDMLLLKIEYDQFLDFSNEWIKDSHQKSVINLMYIKHLNCPCLLLPEHFAINLELKDHCLDIHKSDNLKFEYEAPILLSNQLFNKTGGKAEVSKRYLTLESKTSSKVDGLIDSKFLANYINLKENSNHAKLASVSSSTRETMFRNAAMCCSVYQMKNPNIGRPHRLKKSRNANVLMLYDFKDNNIELISTMEYDEKTVDLFKIPVNELEINKKLYIAVKLAEALFVLHSNEYVHNDFSIKSIVLEKDTNNPVIFDISCCREKNNVNRGKDVESYIRVVRHIFGFGTSIKCSKDIPSILMPLLWDPYENFKTMGDIYQTLFEVALPRQSLDFLYYKEMFSKEISSEMYEMLTEKESEVFKSDVIDRNDKHSFYVYLKDFKVQRKIDEKLFLCDRKIFLISKKEKITSCSADLKTVSGIACPKQKVCKKRKYQNAFKTNVFLPNQCRRYELKSRVNLGDGLLV